MQQAGGIDEAAIGESAWQVMWGGAAGDSSAGLFRVPWPDCWSTPDCMSKIIGVADRKYKMYAAYILIVAPGGG